MQAFPAQIDIAVLQAHFLRPVRLAEHGQRQLFSGGLNHKVFHQQFDLAGGQVGVDRVLRARHDLAGHGDDAFRAHPFQGREIGIIRLQHALGQTVMVAQIHKQQTAMVALAVDPAGQSRSFAHLGFAQLSASMGAISVHGKSSVSIGRSRSGWKRNVCTCSVKTCNRVKSVALHTKRL